jgi:hypothetical protein
VNNTGVRVNRKLNRASSVSVTATLLLLLTAACTPSSFQSASEATLGKTVLGTPDGGVPGNVPTDPPAVPANPGSSSGTDVPVSYFCSNKYTGNAGSNVLQASSLAIEFISVGSKRVQCTETAGVKEALVNQKKLILSACQGLADGEYMINVVDPGANAGQGSNNLLQDDLLVMVVGGSVSLSHKSDKAIEIIYNVNDKAHADSSNQRLSRQDDSASTADVCDRRASPLVIDMSPKDGAETVQLSAPLSGVLFDILGARSVPSAHAKKKISWIQNANFMFLVRPDSHGHVNGIDQLFGDNTRGPDGKFAANGYDALAKFDGRDRDGIKKIALKDAVIDSSDPVFSELRLWSDKNFDGIATSDELYTLDEKGIKAISLNYDARYNESDIYGNQTKYKSLVQMSDGSMRVIFDIWFRYF